MIPIAPHPACEVLAAVGHPFRVLRHEHLPACVNGAFVDDHHAQLVTHIQHMGRSRHGMESEHIAVCCLVAPDHFGGRLARGKQVGLFGIGRAFTAEVAPDAVQIKVNAFKPGTVTSRSVPPAGSRRQAPLSERICSLAGESVAG